MAEEAWVKDVLDFWFAEIDRKLWFEKDDALDAVIVERFGELYERLAGMDAEALASTPRKAIAAVIVFDQFARNMFRGSAKAFAQDGKALEIARRVMEAGDDADLTYDERYFLIMPFMHSEELADQAKCVELFRLLGDETGEKYAIAHRDIIAEFGRFPHRNAALGRETTPEEQAWLDEGGGF